RLDHGHLPREPARLRSGGRRGRGRGDGRLRRRRGHDPDLRDAHPGLIASAGPLPPRSAGRATGRPRRMMAAVGWRRGDAPGRLPRARDALGLGVLAVAPVLGSLAWPAWEPVLDEVVETVLYLGLLWIAVRS